VFLLAGTTELHSGFFRGNPKGSFESSI